MRAGRFLAIMIILDIVLVSVYFTLFLTVFSEPSYAPFASGAVSTLVPDGPHSSSREGAWQRHQFGGKGNLVIGIRQVEPFDLSDLIRRSRGGAPEQQPSELRELVKRSAEMPPGFEPTDLSELAKRSRDDTAEAAPGAAGRPPSGEGPMRIEAGRTYIQLLASNTPNLRVMEEVPAFDSTIFCLGSVGRGDRRYRYLVHAGDLVVDLHMHSAHSSHLVYKEVLDKALLNLRIDGQSSNHILAQALSDLSDRISPRWAQGNIFWLIFFLALPTGIMLILLPVFMVSARRRGAAGGSGPPDVVDGLHVGPPRP